MRTSLSMLSFVCMKPVNCSSLTNLRFTMIQLHPVSHRVLTDMSPIVPSLTGIDLSCLAFLSVHTLLVVMKATLFPLARSRPPIPYSHLVLSLSDRPGGSVALTTQPALASLQSFSSSSGFWVAVAALCGPFGTIANPRLLQSLALCPFRLHLKHLLTSLYCSPWLCVHNVYNDNIG